MPYRGKTGKNGPDKISITHKRESVLLGTRGINMGRSLHVETVLFLVVEVQILLD